MVSELGALPEVEGIVIATPTSAHAESIDSALELGVPVYVEKPLCADPAEARRLAAAGDGRLFVMDKWRYHPAVRALAAIARDSRLGRIVGLRTIRVGWGQGHDDVDSVWVLTPHDLAIALEILGAVPVPRAAAADVVGSAVLGIEGILDVGDVWHALSVSERSAERRREVVLHCEDGIARLAGGWDEHVTLVRPSAGGAHEERLEATGELPLLAELRAFVGHVRGGEPPHSMAAEGALVVETVARLRALAGVE